MLKKCPLFFPPREYASCGENNAITEERIWRAGWCVVNGRTDHMGRVH
jgi:hypothetical protein